MHCAVDAGVSAQLLVFLHGDSTGFEQGIRPSTAIERIKRGLGNLALLFVVHCVQVNRVRVACHPVSTASVQCDRVQLHLVVIRRVAASKIN